MEKTYNFGYDTVRSNCKAALKKLDIKVESVNKKTGSISASTSSSLLSWGEDIKIRFKKINENKTKVSVTSESPSQLISWGKNDKNESSIIHELSKRLK